MNTINVENCKTLLIGRRGENEVTTVAFDFTEWASEFGSGVVDLYVKRFGDDSAYPVVLTIDGTVASWLVTETDTNVAGYGKAEYVYRVDGKIAKSAVFPFFVAEDIGQPASEPPDPYESWLEQLTALGAETEAHAQAAEQSAENAAESAQQAAESATSAEGYAGQAATAAGLAQAAQTASEAARDAAQTAQASAEASATAASGSAASAAGSATAAAGSASDASSSASAAGASATTASTAAGQAEAAKTAAQAAQSAAEDAAEDAQQAAQQAHLEYEQLSGEVDDLSDEVSQQKSAFEAHEQYAEETYAKQDGSYEDLTAGNAYELLSNRGDTNQQPYLFQQTGGDSSAYNREQLKKIVGGTVAWNQIALEPTTTNYRIPSGATLTGSGNAHTIEIVSGGGKVIYDTRRGAEPIVPSGHVVFAEITNINTANLSTNYRLGITVTTNTGQTTSELATNKSYYLVRLQTGACGISLYLPSAVAGDSLTFDNFQFFDLTQMFGTAIADYIYSLEQATAGAGVAFFRSLFPADYYDYNPGELMSVEGVSAHTMRDADNNIVGNYPLDSSLTLRGIPKLDSNNRLYYDGDEYEPDGTVTRKYNFLEYDGSPDESWALQSINSHGIANFYMANIPIFAGGVYAVNSVCNRFMRQSTIIADTTTEGYMFSGGSTLYIRLDSTKANTVAAFKTWLSSNPIAFAYMLATPTAETADPYRGLEICDRDGTEEFVSTSIVPVGHETFYPVNVFDYIDRLTEPDADMIADSAIAANKYFSVGNRLFLSTASIAAGAMIIPGTNCQETSLAAALNALNA